LPVIGKGKPGATSLAFPEVEPDERAAPVQHQAREETRDRRSSEILKNGETEVIASSPKEGDGDESHLNNRTGVKENPYTAWA